MSIKSYFLLLVDIRSINRLRRQFALCDSLGMLAFQPVSNL